MLVEQTELAKIAGVQVDYSGGQLGFDPENVQSWCESWIYEQRSVLLDDDTVADLMVNCELTREEARLQAVCDIAYSEWLSGCDSEPSGADAVAVSPITDICLV